MATKPQASGTSCWPTALCVLIVIVLSDLAIPHQAAFAQDAKQTFVDQKSAGTRRRKDPDQYHVSESAS